MYISIYALGKKIYKFASAMNKLGDKSNQMSNYFAVLYYDEWYDHTNYPTVVDMRN